MIKSDIVFRNFREISVISTNTIPSYGQEVININLSSYEYTKTPHVFIASTYLCSVTISTLTSTTMSVTLYNLYGSAQKCNCRLYVFELNNV